MLRIGFLRIRLNNDPAMKHGVAPITEHTFVTFAAGALRGVVRDVGVIVDMTTTKSEVGTIETCRGALRVQINPSVVTHPGPTHRRRGGFESGGSCKTRKQSAHMESALRLVLHTAIIQRGAFFQDDFGQRVTESPIFCAREMALNHAGSAA